ncbi:Formate C-acetyltransferase [Alkaliphilus metalliredigens QYMF]|uniref:Formate C-acetyltransferase n=1 Tax=Alkaliphilus metalliredigens (strain QYMF) TaxID=293826 RepID=A6TKU3_ALKMQ|nr:trans-4-hydroxy-L-proline dehydratase [Alkaliphilus metalliredigens]ABR46811.1 Formate C-acetyltransferase [Alkaliphilus metalliredigens QYMF]
MEELRGINARTKKLRKQSETIHPSISIERAVLMTQAYEKYSGKVSEPMLRALSFKHLMENKTICINDDELIVGERGPTPQSAPTYPELCCHTIEDLEMMNDREKISFTVTAEDKKIQREKIIPYWQGKSIRDFIFNEMTEEWKDCYHGGIFTEFMEQRAPGHTVGDDKIYKRGFLDFKLEIMEQLESLDYYNDIEAYEKQEQLKAMEICADAIIIFAHRHAEKAKELAENEENPQKKRELEKIAEVCLRVPALPPGNFWEALQSYWFVHLGVITELNTWDAFCPGRLDQHLHPFYQKGIEGGTLTPQGAKELLECFWVKFNNQPAPPKVGITLQESGTYTDFANINIGGLKIDGSDGVNEVSYLLLEVIDEMKLLQPSSNIQVSKKNPDYFIKKAAEVIRKGWGQPSVFNADAVVEELLRQGKSIEDARCGGTSGCVETGAFGKESFILTGYFNLTKVLEITLNNGFDPVTGKKIGVQTEVVENLHSFKALFEAFKVQLNHFIDIKIKGNNIIEKLYAHYMPSPFLSILIDDCIKNAKDYNAGGTRYNTNYIQGVGIASITDSLSAIKSHVFDDKLFTLRQLMETLHVDFKGHEPIRQLLLNKTPRYGNDDDYVDSIMVKVFDAFYQAVNGRKTMRGGTYRINMLPTTCHVYFGSVIGATPDGRKAGRPLSEGISPVQGTDKKGPTAVIKSASKMDQLKTGGTLLNQKFTPNMLEGEAGLENVVHLVRSYFRLDGHHIQFNVVDAATLKKAQANPEAYQNLIVRVAGYSDYFNNLNKGLQDEIIARTEHQAM